MTRVMWQIISFDGFVRNFFDKFLGYIISYNPVILIVEFLVIRSSLRERVELPARCMIVGGRPGVALECRRTIYPDSDFWILDQIFDTVSRSLGESSSFVMLICSNLHI